MEAVDGCLGQVRTCTRLDDSVVYIRHGILYRFTPMVSSTVVCDLSVWDSHIKMNETRMTEWPLA